MNMYIMNHKSMAAALLCLLFTGCQNGRNNKEQAQGEQPQTDILSTALVETGGSNEELVLNGTVTCDERKVSKVFIPCTGKVQNVSCEIGDHVQKGQLLGKVFSQDAAEYEKQLTDIANEKRLAERELAMKRELLESGMASEKDVLEAQGRVGLALAEQNRLHSVAGVQGFTHKSQATLAAPISGYVYAKNVYNGSYIDDTSNDEPAFEIADISTVWVTADVYESDIYKVRQGEQVRISILAYPNDSITGCIDKIYKRLDEESKTMKVRVQIENAEERYLPGMFASVHVALSGAGRQLMRVPAQSIVFENGKNYVVVCDGEGICHRQQVEVAHQDQTYAYLASGVKAGERVIEKNALLQYNILK